MPNQHLLQLREKSPDPELELDPPTPPLTLNDSASSIEPIIFYLYFMFLFFNLLRLKY